MKIFGKTFIVTGGSGGLGTAVVKHLHSLGANLIIYDLNTQSGNKIIEELGKDKCLFFNIDIRNEREFQDSLNDSLKKFKEIHGAITCAGIAPPAIPIINKEGDLLSLDIINNTFSINVIGTINTIRLVSKIINNQNKSTNNDEEKGIFILVSSVAAYDGQAGYTAYSGTKGAISSMTLPLARELEPLSIRVMSIAPGIFRTPMVEQFPLEAIQKTNNSVTFPKRMGNPQEFAFLCQHIIENSYLNGEVIRLDGSIRLENNTL